MSNVRPLSVPWRVEQHANHVRITDAYQQPVFIRRHNPSNVRANVITAMHVVELHNQWLKYHERQRTLGNGEAGGTAPGEPTPPAAGSP